MNGSDVDEFDTYNGDSPASLPLSASPAELLFEMTGLNSATDSGSQSQPPSLTPVSSSSPQEDMLDSQDPSINSSFARQYVSSQPLPLLTNSATSQELRPYNIPPLLKEESFDENDNRNDDFLRDVIKGDVYPGSSLDSNEEWFISIPANQISKTFVMKIYSDETRSRRRHYRKNSSSRVLFVKMGAVVPLVIYLPPQGKTSFLKMQLRYDPLQMQNRIVERCAKCCATDKSVLKMHCLRTTNRQAVYLDKLEKFGFRIPATMLEGDSFLYVPVSFHCYSTCHPNVNFCLEVTFENDRYESVHKEILPMIVCAYPIRSSEEKSDVSMPSNHESVWIEPPPLKRSRLTSDCGTHRGPPIKPFDDSILEKYKFSKRAKTISLNQGPIFQEYPLLLSPSWKLEILQYFTTKCKNTMVITNWKPETDIDEWIHLGLKLPHIHVGRSSDIKTLGQFAERLKQNPSVSEVQCWFVNLEQSDVNQLVEAAITWQNITTLT